MRIALLASLLALVACSSKSAGSSGDASACGPDDGGACARCPTDGKWYCAVGVYATCPSDAPDGGACGDAAPCIACAVTGSQQFTCLAGAWNLASSSVSCAP